MNKVKFLNLLTICRKAARMVTGFDSVKEALAENKAKLVILASDISAKTEKEIRFFAAKTDTAVMKTDMTIEEFHRGMGKKAGVAAICDEGFAEKLSMIISE